MRTVLKHSLLTLLTAVTLTACREDEYIAPSEQQSTGAQPDTSHLCLGFYLLNEGNMGSNHCTLDYLDLATATYHRNIYAERNPQSVKELGDVGNDLQAYGSKLWIVVNCSNKVEVCQLSDTRRLGQINIPNCRYITFHEGFAYVSSFVGPVSLTAHAQLGRIYKVDTLSLQKVDSVTVGYQPEEMAIIGNQLYVANSGGYLLPTYDNSVSQIDLATMTEVRKIPVGTNPHRVEADRHGQLWVSTRGNYNDIAPSLYCLSADADGVYSVTDSLPITVSDMQLMGDSLWFFGTQWSDVSQDYTFSYGILDVRSHQRVEGTLFASPEAQRITMPYGLLVNPLHHDFYLMDAKNFVSSGELLHFHADGTFDWKVRTGDIPSRAVWVGGINASSSSSNDQPHDQSPYIAAVDEYVPAPGQFVNTMPAYEEGDDALRMAQKCTEAIADNAQRIITLGGFGGYVTFHFHRPIQNIAHSADFRIFGNAYAGSSEPGIVQVAVDTNQNGLPDDKWYELAGSADSDSAGLLVYDYQITYSLDPLRDTPWTDNRGGSGFVPRNNFHKQEYFPLWLSSPLTLSGTLLPANGYDQSGKGTYWVLSPLRYGYVDNVANTDTEGNSFDLDWAVDPVHRTPVHLSHADFVRVYSALNQSCGWLGETSTEISGAELVTPSLLPEGR